MTYPKQVMRLNELIHMGFEERWLMTIARRRNNGIAWKAGNAKNSPWLFDTEGLEKARQRACVGR